MAFAQKINSLSVRNFAAMLARVPDQSEMPRQKPRAANLVLVTSTGSEPRKLTTPSVQLGVPRHARQRASDLMRRQQALLAHLNSTLPADAQLVAGSIVPHEAFEGELGRFLILACDFHAASPENTLITPATQADADYLRLPLLPSRTPDTALALSLSKLNWLRETVIVEHRRTALALQHGDLSHLLKGNERQVAYRLQLGAIVQDIATQVCGKLPWNAHEQHFRTAIQTF
jgi:hypothetical protein